VERKQRNAAFAYFPYFEKIKVALYDHHIKFSMPEPVCIKLCVYIMASEPISTAYITIHSHKSVCLYVLPPVVDRQQLGKNVTAAMNTHITIDELLVGVVFYAVRVVSEESRRLFFTELLVYHKRNMRWRARFEIAQLPMRLVQSYHLSGPKLRILWLNITQLKIVLYRIPMATNCC
jgi:hypothetical protein